MARKINRLTTRAVAAITRDGRHADGGGLYLKRRDVPIGLSFWNHGLALNLAKAPVDIDGLDCL
jgi:hypothetical protein